MTIRLLEDHLIPGGGIALTVRPHDDTVSPGHAPTLYTISGFNSASNPSDPYVGWYGKPADHTTLLFQNGALPVTGANGITHESLLAILIDRLRHFQGGDFRCGQNAYALLHLSQALTWLHARTSERMRRGVEGTLTP